MVDTELDDDLALTEEERRRRQPPPESIGGPIAPPMGPRAPEETQNMSIGGALTPPAAVAQPAPLSLEPAPRPRPNYENYEKQLGNKAGVENVHGFGGGLLRTLDTIGSVIAPARMAMIPGTRIHHQGQIEGARRGAEEENREVNSETEEQLRGAQTEEQQALAKKNAAPPQQKFESIAQMHAAAVHDVIAAGGDPSKDPRVLAIEDSIQRIQKEPVPKAPPKESFEEQEYADWAKKQQAAGKPSDRMTFEQERKSTERAPKEPNVYADWKREHPGGTTEQWLATQSGSRAEGTAEGKQKELAASAHQALKNLTALYQQDTPAANYAFLMNFIGMSYEGVRGARLNRAEIERAAMTRTLPDALQHMYDLWIERKQLTSQQKTDMLKTAQALAGTYGPEPAAGGGGAAPKTAEEWLKSKKQP